jgi:hypothetical protein
MIKPLDELLTYANACMSGDEKIEVCEAVTEAEDEILNCYIRLPVDALGRPWHIGDEIGFDNGEHAAVVAISCGQLYYHDDYAKAIEWTRADNKRHWEQTVEDVLIELIDTAIADISNKTRLEKMTYNDWLASNNVIENYAKKLKLVDG